MDRRAAPVVFLTLLIGASASLFVLNAPVRSVQSLTDDLCGNRIVATIPSPDGNLKAVLFERDCGATTGFTEHVSVLRSGNTLPNDFGNIYQSESGGTNGDDSKIRWFDNNTLQIEPVLKSRVFWHEVGLDIATGPLQPPHRVRIAVRERIARSNGRP